MRRVLVVDDEEKIRDCFARFLSLKGYQVQEACDGAQAVTAAAREAFDIVLMDIRMPVLDGLSAWQHIRQTAPKAKLILITGMQRPEGEGTIEEQAVLCLHKPILLQDLEIAMEQACQGAP